MAAFALEGIDCTAFFPEREAGPGPAGYAKGLLEKVTATKADFVFSINGLGVDFNGPLPDMLNRLGARFATWYVDSPELFFHALEAPNANAIIKFCCDPEGAQKVDELHYLPLGVDSSRFKLDEPIEQHNCPIPVSFIGASWVDKLAATHKEFRFPPGILTHYKQVAQELAHAEHRGSITQFIESRFPDFHNQFASLSPEMQRGALHLLCWEGNRAYRLQQLEYILPYSPIIAGDRHWQRLLKNQKDSFTYHPQIGYYTPDLARFYRSSAINYSPSGVQMRQAINQRAFDVPAAGGFLLSDKRTQLDSLFIPGEEAVSYTGTSDLTNLIKRFQNDTVQRTKVINAARKRMAAHHTYRHRVREICRVLD